MRRAVLIVVAVAALGAGGAAFGAQLGVTTASLTAYSAASTVPTSLCTLAPVSDAYVDTNAKNTNFGTATTLVVQASAKPQRAFVRFSVGSCVPANAKVASASLKLFLRTAPAQSRTYAAAPASAAWTETGITWAAQPAVGTATSVATGTTNGVQLQWNVAADVQAVASGGADNGWRISDATEASVTAYTGTFDSREGTTAPSLVVTYWP